MILQKEIVTIAEQHGVSKSIIDKDWVLSHFIAAMYSEPEIIENLIFKGGTCLRKCWVPDYRFSEDLDFTASTSGYEFSEQQLMVVCDKVVNHSGIQLHIDSFKPLNFNNKKVGFESYVKYWGADHSKNRPPPPPARWNTRIKIEIILYHRLSREILHVLRCNSIKLISPTIQYCFTS